MISSFKNYLVEEEKTVYFTFGRMNPPTIGHEKLLKKLAEKAGRNPYRIFLSPSSGDEKNPIDYRTKVKFARKAFPKYARSIMMSPNARNVMEVATAIYNEGFKNVVMVVGSDRVTEFHARLHAVNGKKGRHGFFNFQKITIESAGQRDPESDKVKGASGTKMRAAAVAGDFTKFAQGLPAGLNNADAKDVFNAVRKGLGLKEKTNFRNHVQFEPVNDLRESYMNGKLFEQGEEVVIKENGIVGKITHLGSNYVIVESNGQKYRKWLTQIESMSAPQDKDISDRKGTQPAKYHAGLKKSTKAKRDAQFKKQAKMADDDPKAYKPAPGDKTAKTKPSKYTTAYNNMFGEDMKPEITVGNYTTTHFYMCPSATKAMTKHKSVDGAEQLTKMQDDYFKFEKMFINKQPSANDKAKAISMYNKIIAKAKEAGIEKDVKPYMDDHRDSITKGDPKPGFGRADIKEYKMEMPKKKVLRFRKFGEEDEPTAVDIAKQKIDREKQADKRKHDRMMDRARMRVTQKKNKETNPND